jgi:endoglucanase
VSDTIGSERMQGFTDWLRENEKQGFLGEFATFDDDVCLETLDDQLRHIEENADVYLGWTWWAAGPKCVSFTMAVDPLCGPETSPQLEILKAHLESYQD